jgi:periplasmic protein TonB
MARFRISRELSVAVLVSVGLHAVWLAREAKASSASAAVVAEVSLEAQAPRQRAPEPKAEPTPEPTNSPPEPVVRNTSVRTQPASGRALPVAAQAARTMTAPDNDEGSSLADFTMVQGEGTQYAGGTTSAIGTSRAAVRGPKSDAPATVQRAILGPKSDLLPDRSRSATPAVPAWDCSRLFPSDANAGDYATVLIAVSVRTDGSPKRVAMLRDPGHGFGAAAIQCAMSQRFNVALDRQGSPIAATTPPIIVRFSR